MPFRSIKQWEEILRPLDEIDAAERVLNDLTGYPIRTPHKNADASELACAMQAWARLAAEERS